MNAIVILDTTVYLNILDVPGKNQSKAEVLQAFETAIRESDYFLLPMATVWEAGNHIARLGNGHLRRTYAQKLVGDVLMALTGQVPYRATHFPERDEFSNWLADFPDAAMRNKSPEKTAEGTSLADLSIIKEWQRNCDLHPMSRVRIWSLDEDLAGRDRRP